MTSSRCQHGASLIVTLLMLVVIMMLGISTASIAIQGEKAARSDRDRHVAWNAAQNALADAELDIEASPDPARSRSMLFSRTSTTGFPSASEENCHTIASAYFGMCRKAVASAVPTWLDVDFAEAGADARAVPYGTFTGRSMQTDTAALPRRLPRYIIELVIFKPAESTTAVIDHVYRISAVGFGIRESTRVMLQTYYRKTASVAAPGSVTGGRLSWREVSNWQEMRHAALHD
ncbi:MAG: pilus assembly protein [Herminiimonas sp.]|nr:pilus assembly protein [Herminiimonas sp.]